MATETDYDTVIVINDGLRKTTTKTGRTSFSVEITGEPVIADFNVKELGRQPALAIAAALRRKVGAIVQAAAPATLRARKRAAKALEARKPWALKRYAGGRTGELKPNESMSLFKDSGRLEKSIAVGPGNDNAWHVNVAANRLDPATADNGGESAVLRIFARLTELVPEFGNPVLLAEDFGVRRAIEDSRKQLVTKARATADKMRAEVAKGIVELARTVFDIAGDVGGRLTG